MRRTSRRRFLLASAALTASLAGCYDRGAPPDPGAATPTSTETASSTGTTAAGTTTDPTTESPPDDSSPHVVWRREVDGSVTALASSDDALSVGTKAGELVSLSADGSERWSASFDDPVTQVEPAGDLALVVVGASELFANHRVVALDAASGEERWAFAPEEWWLDVLGTHDGTVYVATSDDAIANSGQTLYAVARDDGSVRWSGEVGDNSGALLTDDAVYVTSFGRIYAYGHDGTQRWTLDVNEYGRNSIVAVDDTVAFAGVEADLDTRRQSAIGVSAADGSTRWTVDGWYVTSLVAHDGRLFAGGKRVVEIDPETGETAWQFDPGGSIYDAPIADGALFTMGESVHAVDIDDGSGRWSFESALYSVRPIAAIGNALYTHASKSRDDRDRHVVALDVADGSERWRFVADSRLTATALAGDRLVAGSDDGVVYAFE